MRNHVIHRMGMERPSSQKRIVGNVRSSHPYANSHSQQFALITLKNNNRRKGVRGISEIIAMNEWFFLIVCFLGQSFLRVLPVLSVKVRKQLILASFW